MDKPSKVLMMDKLGPMLKAKKPSKMELHKATGLARNSIDGYLAGACPDLDALDAIADALGVKPWDLIRPNEPAKPSLAPAPLPFADLEKELRKLGHGHALNFLKGWITEVREFNQILQERQAGKDPSQGETD